MSATTSYRLAVGVAVATTLLLLLGIGALGIIGDGGRPDLMYLAAPLVALAGALAARLRPGGTALALAVAAATTVAVGLVAIAAGMHQDDGASAIDILGLSAMYAGLFALSGFLFWRAADRGP